MFNDPLPSSANDARWAETWHDLGQGAPSLAGFARICSYALATGGVRNLPLSIEAKTILFAARERATIEIKGANRAFDAPARMLAVYIETSPEVTLIFRNRENPVMTIRFLAGFRELCQAGLVMHHIQHDFSLTRDGLDAAAKISADEVREQMDAVTQLSTYE